jgi:hypothetical protein
MREKCFDEGMIQAFFDGELESGLLEQVARHVSDCNGCAMMMGDIEAESASVAAAFEIENFELVPTERLRTKIFTEIAELENGRTSWLQKAAAAFGFSKGFKWTSPSVAAFASLIFVIGVVALVLTSTRQETVIKNPVASAAKPVQRDPAPQDPATTAAAPSLPAEAVENPSPKFRQASYVEPKIAAGPETKRIAAESQPLDDEQRYLQTIATLKKSVDNRKDNMLKPSALVAYERDMAVVDDAIKKLQKAARKNPRDEASKQILLASYQNKIDLLSAVSDKTELMATLR